MGSFWGRKIFETLALLFCIFPLARKPAKRRPPFNHVHILPDSRCDLCVGGDDPFGKVVVAVAAAVVVAVAVAAAVLLHHHLVVPDREGTTGPSPRTLSRPPSGTS